MTRRPNNGAMRRSFRGVQGWLVFLGLLTPILRRRPSKIVPSESATANSLSLRSKRRLFCMDTQEVIASVRWGFEIPADKTAPVVVLGAMNRDVDKGGVTNLFKAIIAKANDVGKNGVMTYAKIDGSSLISKPTKPFIYGGVSALP